MMRFKIAWMGSSHQLSLSETSTLGDLLKSIRQQCNIPLEGSQPIKLQIGYPFVDVGGTVQSPLSAVGIRSGDKIQVTNSDAGDIYGEGATTLPKPPPPQRAPTTGNSIGSSSGGYVSKELDFSELLNGSGGSNNSYSSSDSSNNSNSSKNSGSRKIDPEVRYLMDMGYDEEVSSQAIAIAGPGNFELAIDICGQLASDRHPPKQPSAVRKSEAESLELSSVPTAYRRVIDADNSCLFNAIGYLIHRDRHSKNEEYRQLVVGEVLSDPQTYSAAMLGKPIEEYVAWIQHLDSWGGEIELLILSKQLQLEIVVICIETGTSIVYSGPKEENWNRIFLLYDGIHYDALVKVKQAISSSTASTYTPPEAGDITIFPSSDHTMEQECLEIGRALKASNKFVNVAKLNIQCLICRKFFKGQPEAVQHAKETGHQNFHQAE